MTVRSLLCAALLACIAPAHSAHAIALGVTAGVNIANVSADSVNGTPQSKSGVTVGFVAELGIPSGVGIRFLPSLVQKGATIVAEPTGSLAPVTPAPAINLTYIDLPLVLRVGLGHSSWHPFISAGPSIGILLSAEQDSAGVTTDIKPRLDTKEIGLNAAAGFDIPLALHTALAIEGRYTAGIQDIRKTEGGSLPINANVHTRGVQILAAWIFRLGPR